MGGGGDEAAFIPQRHPGNPFAALHVSKNLSELERLRLAVAKLEIENERLKKDTGWKELVQTGNMLPDPAGVRNHRRNEREISDRLSLPTHGSQQSWLLQMERPARKYVYKKAGEEHIEFPNKVKGNWNAARPVELVASDMTTFNSNGIHWEWTLLVDTFSNEILAHQATPVQGSTKPYYNNERPAAALGYKSPVQYKTELGF